MAESMLIVDSVLAVCVGIEMVWLHMISHRLAANQTNSGKQCWGICDIRQKKQAVVWNY